MRSDQSVTSRSRSPGLSPVTGMLKTTVASPPPVTITEPPQKTLASKTPSTSRAPPRKPPLAMHKSTNNLKSNASSGSNSPATLTPRLPGYRAATAAGGASSPSPSGQPASAAGSSSPNASPRLVRPATARRQGEAATESSAAPRRSSYVGPQVRPMSSMSSVSALSPGPPLRASRPGSTIASANAHAYAYASSAAGASEPAPRPSSPASAKFFHANDLKPSRKPTPGPQLQPPKLFKADASHSAPATAPILANPASTTHLTPRLPSQSTRPSSPVGSPQSAYTGGSVRGVKFVYANGTEEVLEPRGKATSTSEGSSRPPSPNPLSPGLQSSSSSTSKFQTPPGSTVGTLSPSQPVNSPTAQRPQLGVGRKSSVGSTSRHGRAHSIGANGLPQEIFLVPEALRSPVSAPRPTGSNGAEEIYMAPAALTLKMREELAANARQERKVMDLEISNNSLLAINRTIERKMRKQNSELRRYRRLARSGQFQPKTPPSSSSKRRSSKSTADDVDYITNEIDGDLLDEEEADRDAGDEDEDDDEEDEEDEEDEDEDDDLSQSSADENDPNSTTGGATSKRKRTIARTDRDKVSAELSKHQALLEASAKTNASLKRCTYMIEELIKEANKALTYKVAASEVKIGGRILGSDNEDEGDEDDEEEDDDNGRGENGGCGDGNETETEAETDDMTGTEAETTDDSREYSDGKDDVDTETEDEGHSSQID
ncbi:hypothetical protein DFH27DRAFT_629073 [Peziza echinospora]|nr:hypothetical protein DFH27DRAFT_629073 [Peziza echinospora]